MSDADEWVFYSRKTIMTNRKFLLQAIVYITIYSKDTV